MYKNKYIQNHFGQCNYVAIANAFNRPDLIPLKEDCINGLSWINARKLVEKEIGFTLQCLYYSVKHINYYIPVFEIETDIPNNKDYYTFFFVSVLGESNGFNHCVLVIKENFNNTLIVLDPYKKESVKVPLLEFFHYYDVTGIESVVNKEHGGTMFFDESHLSHLI